MTLQHEGGKSANFLCQRAANSLKWAANQFGKKYNQISARNIYSPLQGTSPKWPLHTGWSSRRRRYALWQSHQTGTTQRENDMNVRLKENSERWSSPYNHWLNQWLSIASILDSWGLTPFLSRVDSFLVLWPRFLSFFSDT